jgi:hypothetical protein
VGLSFNGTSSKLELASAVVSAYPFTIFGWVKPASASTGFGGLVSMGASGGTQYVGAFDFGSVNGKIAARTRGSSSADANSTTGIVTASWQPFMAVFTSASSRTIYYASGAAVTNTATESPTLGNLNRLRLGVFPTAESSWFNGDMAEVAIWTIALGSTEWTSLSGGASPPTVQPDGLLDYWSLFSTAASQTGLNGRVLTASNTSTSATHPPIISSVIGGAFTNASSFGAVTLTSDAATVIIGGNFLNASLFGAETVASNAPSPVFIMRGAAAGGAFGTPSSYPTAIYRNGSTYVGWISNTGTCGVTRYNHDTSTISHFTLANLAQKDNHNNASLAFLSDGRLIAFYSKHPDASVMRYRITTSTTGDISAWSAEATRSLSTTNTYAQVVALSKNSKVYCGFRAGDVGGTNRPTNVISTADGATWDAERSWISSGATGRPYAKARSNGYDRIDIIFVPDNPGNDTTSLYHCYMQLDASNNELFYTTNGTLIGAGPVTPGSATLIYNGSTNRAWGYDVAIGFDGFPWATYCQWNGSTNRTLRFARWDGTAWINSDIVAEGTTYDGYYFGGVAFDDHNPCVVYVSKWDSTTSKQQVEEWRTTNMGKTWAKFRNISAGTSGVIDKAVSPFSPWGHDGRCAVVWHSEDGVIGYNNWTNVELVGAVGTRAQIEVRDRIGTLKTNMTGLQAVVFDGGRPIGLSVKKRPPLLMARDLYTDANGILRVPASGAQEPAVFIVVTDTQGGGASDSNATARPVPLV